MIFKASMAISVCMIDNFLKKKKKNLFGFLILTEFSNDRIGKICILLIYEEGYCSILYFSGEIENDSIIEEKKVQCILKNSLKQPFFC
jgi:hypothetical protein